MKNVQKLNFFLFYINSGKYIYFFNIKNTFFVEHKCSQKVTYSTLIEIIVNLLQVAKKNPK